MSKDQAFLVCIFCANQARKDRKWTEKNAFYTKKVKKTNLSNRNFPKELVYEFCLKIVLFLICVFWPNQARKHRFLIHWIEKNTFKTRKEKLQKSPKNQTFPKGLDHALLKNRHFCHLCFPGKAKQKRSFSDILDIKNAF